MCKPQENFLLHPHITFLLQYTAAISFVRFVRTTISSSLLIGYRIERSEDLSVLHRLVVWQKRTNESITIIYSSCHYPGLRFSLRSSLKFYTLTVNLSLLREKWSFQDFRISTTIIYLLRCNMDCSKFLGIFTNSLNDVTIFLIFVHEKNETI